MTDKPKPPNTSSHRQPFDANAFQLARQGRLTHHGRTRQLAPRPAPDPDEQRAREMEWEAQLGELADARKHLISTGGAAPDVGAMLYRVQLPVDPSVLNGPARRRGQRPALSEIEEARDALRSEGKWSGEREIAARLTESRGHTVTRDQVRWALGKDR